mmetsp:Transcript_99495/g.156912  ORF Transcript_99495/g.156912 Transcript_99495/m.156912 type:complete len:235 (+) Transcript_99495:2-706(+)
MANVASPTDNSCNGIATKGCVPEAHLLLVWLATLVLFLGATNTYGGSAIDYVVVISVLAMFLAILSPRLPTPLLLIVAYIFMGIIVGAEVIDLCFDLIVLRGVDIDSTMPARRLAWYYYRNMLIAPHVNCVIVISCLFLFFGALAGVSRSPRKDMRKWATLLVAMVVGNGGYVFCICPYYVQIRTSVEYDPAHFDGWEVVFAARLTNFVALIVSWVIMFSLLPLHYQKDAKKAE